jgi:hypothetical protein
MRTVSTAYRTLLAFSHPVLTFVDSWLGGDQLASNLPVVTGRLNLDDTGQPRGRLTLTLPARLPARRLDLDPAGNPAAPLANYGQRLNLRTGLMYPNRAVELFDLGWYLITGWAHNEENRTIDVEAVDLAQVVIDDKLTEPLTPAPGATFKSEFTRLIGGILPVSIPAGFPDRPVSSSAVWDRDREKSLADLCAAWPARWFVNDQGAATVAAPYGPVSDATPADFVLTDGAAGTVVSRARGSQRGALANVSVVDGKTGDGGAAAPHAVAVITDPASPIRAAGPYGRVTRFYASDLITTQAQADEAAAAQLVSYATAGRTESATAVPDPSVELGDVVRIFTRDGKAFTGRVRTIDLPVTADNGAMGIGIATLPMGVI